MNGVWLKVSVVLWAGVLIGGVAVLGQYQGEPGAQRPAPAAIPIIPGVSAHPDRHTLLVAIHPHCPCTHATVGELERVLTDVHRAGGEMPAVFAMVYRPGYEASAWAETTLRDRLDGLPGVTLVDDPDGRHGTSVGALTSGHVVLYSPEGEPVYQGGITAGRGHEGDNAGKLALLDHLLNRAEAKSQTHVYGCELTNARVEKR